MGKKEEVKEYHELLRSQYEAIAFMASRKPGAFTLSLFDETNRLELIQSGAVDSLKNRWGFGHEIYLIIDDPQTKSEILQSHLFHKRGSRYIEDVVPYKGKLAVRILLDGAQIFFEVMAKHAKIAKRPLFSVDENTAELITLSEIVGELRQTDLIVLQTLTENADPFIKFERSRPGLPPSLHLTLEPRFGMVGELALNNAENVRDNFKRIVDYFALISPRCECDEILEDYKDLPPDAVRSMDGTPLPELDPVDCPNGMSVKLPNDDEGKLAFATFRADYDLVIPFLPEVQTFCHISQKSIRL